MKRTNPESALALAVERIGGQSKMARLLDLSQPAVWRWVKKGKALPPEHVLTVETATGVSRHDLRPDIYPREDVASVPARSGEVDPLDGLAA